jgi:hypothetical protein
MIFISGLNALFDLKLHERKTCWLGVLTPFAFAASSDIVACRKLETNRKKT